MKMKLRSIINNLKFSFKKNRKNRVLILGTLILFMSGLVLASFVLRREPDAAWFDDTYGYRHRVTFTHNADISSDRAVTFTLDTAELISAGLMQSDCDDTRFTDGNGKVLLFDLTGTCNNAATTYEVIFPSIVNGSNLFYVYYGNAAAPNIEINSAGYTALTPSGGDPSLTNPTSSGNQEKSPGPLVYYSFDQGTDNTCSGGVNDVCNGGISAASADAAISGMTTPSANSGWQTEDQCVSGKCLRWDGTDDMVTVSSFTLPATMTIQAWIKPDTFGGSNLGRIAQKDNQFVFNLDSSGTKLDFTAIWSGDDGVWTSASAINLNAWHHVTLIYDGSATTNDPLLYVNGNPVTLTQSGGDPTGSFSLSANTLYIGNNSADNRDFDGTIDEFKIYPYARSSAQVKADFANAATPKGVSASFGGPNQKFLSDGLVAYWKMDEASWTNDCSTGTVLDSSGMANNGTACPNAFGPTGGVAGKFGNSGNFDGTNEYIKVTQPASLSFTSDFTVSLWVKTTRSDTWTWNGGTNGFPTLIGQDVAGCSGGENDWFFGLDLGKPQFWQAGTSCDILTADNTVNDGTWRLITVTRVRSSGLISIFIDGQLHKSAVLGTGPMNGAADLFMGSINGSSDFFDGQMDDVRLYNRALSGSEVAALYNWAPGPAGYWPFDENTGQSTYDKSSNASTGTFGGTVEPIWKTGKYGSGLFFTNTTAANSRVDISSPAVLDQPTALTISAWIYPQTEGENSFGRIIDKGTDNSCTSGWCFSTTSSGGAGRLEFRVDHATTDLLRQSGNNSITLNTWQYVTVVWDGSSTAAKIKFYVNGVEVSTYATTTNGIGGKTDDSASNIRLGNDNSTSRTFDGTLDDIRVYNYVRSQKQITEDMNAGHPSGGSPIASQTIYWAFDEQQGTLANNKNPAQSSLTGTITGAAWNLENSTINCKLNGCLNLDTATDDVTASDPAFFDGLTGMTASFWLNPQTLATTGAIVSKSNTNRETFLIQTDAANSDELRVYISDAVTDSSNYYTTNNLDLSVSNWYHIAVVYDATAPAASRLKVYKNGQLASGSVTGNIQSNGLTASTANFQVGESHKGTSALLALIDEVKIYSSALSPSEVLVDANAGSSAALGGVLGTHDSEGFGGLPPVLEWNLNENTGSTVNDTSGSGKTGAIQNINSTNFWTNGKVGSAIQFIGGDINNTDIRTNATFTPPTQVTVEAWLFPLGAGGGSSSIVFNSGSGSATGYFLIQSGTSCYRWRSRHATNGQWFSAAGTVTLNSWQHVAVTYDASSTANNPTIYINGQIAAQDNSCNTNIAPSGGWTSTAGNWAIGGDVVSTTAYYGTIDQVKVYNYIRTPAQIAYDYNRGAPIAWYKFDECQGTTAYNSAINGNGQAMGMNGTITPGAGANTSAGTCNSGTSTEMWNDGTTGKYNGSLGFDGTDDYVAVSGTTTNRITGDITFGGWFKATSVADTEGLIYMGGGSGETQAENELYMMRWDTQSGNDLEYKHEAGAGGNTVLSFDVNLSTGTWYHAMFVRNVTANTVQLYLNGVSQGTKSYFTDPDGGTSADLAIGRESSGPAYFDGQIDDVRIYDYALTSTQVKRVYNEGSAVRFGPNEGSP